MKRHQLSRRQFLRSTSVLAGAALLSPWDVFPGRAAAAKRTAVDQVPLGKTGIRLSRLGFGTGSSSGSEQTSLGKGEFIRLLHYAYDRGITYIDTAQSYQTFEWIGDAIKGLPREKLFLQSKILREADNVLPVIDHHRKVFDTDYIDSLLIHCMTRGGWTDQWKRVMDGFDEAKQKKWIRAKGVSCHTLPALRNATASEWTEVHLVRVNPQGRYMDGMTADWGGSTRVEVSPVMDQIKAMHQKGRGVIGMKIIGNGDFRNPEDREKSIRFAMACKDIDAVVIGFTNRGQADEAIERMNRALAET
jgi:predicted aldo/keto reductase-like oxidoreductase